MEIMLVGFFLSTAFGTIVGVTAGLLLINRRNRFKPTGEHLAALRNELSGAAPDAAVPAAGSPGVNLEDLRRLVVDRDDALRQSREELERAQLQAEQCRAEAQQEAQQRAAAEQRAQDLAAQLASFAEKGAEWEAGAKMREDLEGRIAALMTELTAARDTSQGQLDAHSKVQEAHRQEQEALNARIASLAEELAAARHSSQEDGSYRTSLEAQLTADREYIGQLTAQIAEAQREMSHYETRLIEQRQVAAKGLELLNQAQDNFANIFRTLYSGVETPVAAE
jgi:chromosome segregation ATPase